MAFPAVYAGTCPECGSRIHLGDLIAYSDDHELYVHASCNTTPVKPEPVCPECFLTICDCNRSV